MHRFRDSTMDVGDVAGGLYLLLLIVGGAFYAFGDLGTANVIGGILATMIVGAVVWVAVAAIRRN